MKKIKYVALFLFFIAISNYVVAQSFQDSFLVKVFIDSITSYGPVRASEMGDTTVRLYCKKNIYLTVEMVNNAQRTFSYIPGGLSITDFYSSVLDWEIEGYDSSTNKFIEIMKPFVQPILFDEVDRHVAFLPGQIVRQDIQCDYVTRINQLNRIRMIIKLRINKNFEEKIYSDWISIPWKEINFPWPD